MTCGGSACAWGERRLAAAGGGLASAPAGADGHGHGAAPRPAAPIANLLLELPKLWEALEQDLIAFEDWASGVIQHTNQPPAP